MCLTVTEARPPWPGFALAVPAPPLLHTRVVDGSTVQAVWEPSGKMGQPQGFKLFYRRLPSATFTGPLTFGRNVTRCNITQLGEWGGRGEPPEIAKCMPTITNYPIKM